VSCLSRFACAVLQCSPCPFRRARPLLRRPRSCTSLRRRVRGSIGGRDGRPARPAITLGLAAVVAGSICSLRSPWRRPRVSRPRVSRPRVHRERRRNDAPALNAGPTIVQLSGHSSLSGEDKDHRGRSAAQAHLTDGSDIHASAPVRECPNRRPSCRTLPHRTFESAATRLANGKSSRA
jgi:hypothetical protein